MQQPPSFAVTITHRTDGVRLVAVAGELDIATGPSLAAAVALVPPGRAILDLAGVTFADCAGYRALGYASLDLAARGMIHVARMAPAVHRIARLIRA